MYNDDSPSPFYDIPPPDPSPYTEVSKGQQTGDTLDGGDLCYTSGVCERLILLNTNSLFT